MSLINRLLQRISRQSRLYRMRRRRPFSPFGIQAAQVETLENRRLLSALTVTTAADSGAGSLRAEIAAANSGDTINFAASLKGQTITLTSGELLINKGLTIQGPGAAQLTISGGNSSRVFDVASSQPVVLAGLTISNGSSSVNGRSFGGGIYEASGGNLTVSACTISNCHASLGGGGIYNTGVLTASGCTLSGDSVLLGMGGGIYNTGNLRASGCTLSGDSVTYGMGGGIYSSGFWDVLKNCTIAGCSAGAGGGVYVGGGNNNIMVNCTVSLNQANGLGGGIDVVLSGGSLHLSLSNTIVAGNAVNTPTGYSELSIGADIYGPVFSAYNNLIGNGAGCSIGSLLGGPAIGNIVGNPSHVINALLGPLQNNGGPTMTMALLAGSPAIRQANNLRAPTTDQRGVTRLDQPGELTDIGAYEV